MDFIFVPRQRCLSYTIPPKCKHSSLIQLKLNVHFVILVHLLKLRRGPGIYCKCIMNSTLEGANSRYLMSVSKSRLGNQMRGRFPLPLLYAALSLCTPGSTCLQLTAIDLVLVVVAAVLVLLPFPLPSLSCCIDVLYFSNSSCLVTGSIVFEKNIHLVILPVMSDLAGFLTGLGLLSFLWLSHKIFSFENCPMLTPLSKISWSSSLLSDLKIVEHFDVFLF